MTDKYPDDWTERPHWVTMVAEPGNDPWCAGHHPTEKLAEQHAAKRRREGVNAYVEPVGQASE